MVRARIIALSCIVALPVALNYLPGFFGLILNLGRWPALLVLVALALACIYRYGASRDEPKWRWLTWGSAFAALAWLGFSAVFSFYADHFGTFNKTYGSLGAVIGFMTWMWLSVAVILIGGKLNAEMEHQTARDSTEGTPQPMGARRAKMADTVGQAQP
jgi:membrane protein